MSSGTGFFPMDSITDMVIGAMRSMVVTLSNQADKKAVTQLSRIVMIRMLPLLTLRQ